MEVGPRIQPPRLLKHFRGDIAYVAVRPDGLERRAVVSEEDVWVPERRDDLVVEFLGRVVRGEICLEGRRAHPELGELGHQGLRFGLGRCGGVVHRDVAAEVRKGTGGGLANAATVEGREGCTIG